MDITPKKQAKIVAFIEHTSMTERTCCVVGVGKSSV
jgi:hypothetical protein